MFGHPMELPLSSFTNNYANKNKKVETVQEEDEEDEYDEALLLLPSAFL